MTLPLSASFRSYRIGARAVQAKSLGSLALGAVTLAAIPNEAAAQITVTTGSASVGVDQTLSFNPQTGSLTSTPPSIKPFLGVLGSAYDDGVRSFLYGNYDFRVAVDIYGSITERFAFGAPINGAGFFHVLGYFNTYIGNVVPTWAGVTGYAGMKMTISGSIHYGWVKVTTNADASTLTFNAMGFNTVAGEGITAGQGLTPVPEPATSTVLLALGAAGLVAYRQRKKIQRAA